MIIRTVNIICLAVLFFELAILTANLIFKNSAERIAFLRSFTSSAFCDDMISGKFETPSIPSFLSV